MKKSDVLVITGPTATGKTALSICLAKRLGGEIVGADSMQIYKGMDIGTAKPTMEEREGIPHHMIDVVLPSEPYSAYEYVRRGTEIVDDIRKRGKLPIITGGTGLYIDSLIRSRTFAPLPQDGQLRSELRQRFDNEGGDALHRQLAEIDPLAAQKIHPNDPRRMIRALEVYALTGKPISAHNLEEQRVPPRYRARKVALMTKDRQTLYDRINKRVDLMMEQGLLQEVEGLLATGIDEHATAMQAIGYKELAAALRGDMSIDEAVEKIKQESRRYAKRQLSWLRADRDVWWGMAGSK